MNFVDAAYCALTRSPSNARGLFRHTPQEGGADRGRTYVRSFNRIDAIMSRLKIVLELDFYDTVHYESDGMLYWRYL
jgi:hypothetical protein